VLKAVYYSDMEKFRLLITDLTTYGQLRCIAGWDLDRKRMIRPEPRPGDFWPAAQTGAGTPFCPGAIAVFSAAPPKPVTDYPHLTEDHVVEGKIVRADALDAKAFAAALDGLGSTLK
jgi:hypothetical protein